MADEFNHVASPPTRPRLLGRRTVAVVVAAGLVFGVAVALPIVLLTRNNSSSSSSAASSPSGGGGAGTATAARTLYNQALAATRASKGVHYSAQVTGVTGAQRTTGDAGQGTGTQQITVDTSYGAEQFSLLLVSGTVYFQGNAAAVQDQLGVPAASAADVAGKWVSVVRGDGPYAVLQPGITTADQATEMPLVPTTTQAVTSGGTRVTRINGTTPGTATVPAGTATMDVDPTSHLPLTYSSKISAGSVTVTSTTTFTKWGTAPSPAAPSGAVAWTTLGATQPPGGYGSGGGGTGATPPAA
jgi:hypothetical protein